MNLPSTCGAIGPRRARRRPGTRARPRHGRRASARARSPRSRPRRAWPGTRSSSSAPATQPIHSSMLRRISAGTSPRTTTSDTAKRPPGLSTRNASASTRSLSAERLITQLEMITSTESSGSGIALDLALEELDVVDAGLALVLARQRQHLVGHVEPVGLAGGADPPRGEQHVDAAAGAEVEHRLARVELGQRGRVAAAERGRHRLCGERRGLALRVEVGGDRVALPPRDAAGAAAGRARPPPPAARPGRTSPSRSP